jgi:hypothetical protein
MDPETLTGGCLCGAVRYAARGKPMMTAICHCTMCRRAHAAPMVAWIMFEDAEVEWSGEARAEYASSPPVRRSFCGRCGTPLAFVSEEMPGLVDLTVGSLDDPACIQPDFHYWDAERLPWVKVADGLPRHPQLPPFGDG